MRKSRIIHAILSKQEKLGLELDPWTEKELENLSLRKVKKVYDTLPDAKHYENYLAVKGRYSSYGDYLKMEVEK